MFDKSKVVQGSTEARYYGMSTENGITERVKKLSKQMHEAKYGVCLHRTRCFTEIYQAHEEEPAAIKKALAVAKTLDTLPLLYNEGELIIGQQSTRIKAKPLHCEVETGWIVQEGGLHTMAHRTFNPCYTTEEEQREFDEEIAPYWYPRTLLARWQKKMPEEIRDRICGTFFGEPTFMLALYGSHTHLDWEAIVKYGTNHFKEYAQKQLDNFDYTDLKSSGKDVFWKACIIVLEAMERFSHRWADFMRDKAANTTDAALKAEYLEIAEICDWVPHNAPRTFREALQAMWLVECAFLNDSTGPLLALGRMDQYLLPFYRNDIKNGTITREGAMELLQLFYIKCNNDFMFVDNDSSQHTGGNVTMQNVIVGGCDKYGNDAANELSMLIIDAFIQAHILQPALCARLNKKSSEEFRMKILDCIEAGMGFPSIFNDDVGIACASRYGNTQQQAYDYTCSGCMEIGHPGSYWWGPGQWINFGAAADLAMTNGIRRPDLPGRKAGERISYETGDPRDFKTFEEFMDAVKTHIRAQMDYTYIADKRAIEVYQDYPLLVQSIFTNSCLERGLAYHSGGIRTSSVPGYASVGMADMADHCAAVKKLVFDDKVLTMDELCKALDANFEGYEDIRQMCLACPKWGNDDDYVDSIEAELIGYYGEYALSEPGVLAFYDPEQETAAIRHRRGASMSPVSGNIPYGFGVGALASGRKAGESLGDAAGAYMGMDKNGPTAAIRSYGKVDYFGLHGGIVNLYIEKKNLETIEARQKVLALLKGAMDNGMAHIQFNIMDKEVLEDAKKHPEQYPTLIVRVAGYSAYWVELDESIQDAIIARTQHNVG